MNARMPFAGSALSTALFQGEITGVIASIYENERPLLGFAGLLDWRFNCLISKFLANGMMEGSAGEFTYVPANKNGKTYHLLLVGAGRSTSPGKRHALPTASVEVLEKNLKLLSLENIGASKGDLIDFHKKSVRLFE